MAKKPIDGPGTLGRAGVAIVVALLESLLVPTWAHSSNRWLLVGAYTGAGYKGIRGIIKIVPG